MTRAYPVAPPLRSPADPEGWGGARVPAVAEAARATARLAASLGGGCARVYLRRPEGGLAPAAEAGDWRAVRAAPPSEVPAAPRRVALRSPLGFGLGLLPLGGPEEPLGVLAVAGPRADLEDRWEALGAAADVSARLLRAEGEPAGDGVPDEAGLRERLDMAMTWTAHELRAPLLGAKAVIGCVREYGNLPEEMADLLRRSEEELAGSFEVLDALLRWASGGGRVERRPVDVGRVVREAVASCGVGRERLRVSVASRVSIRADGPALRAAVANLIRNALAYSEAEVEVRVGTAGGDVLVSVSDRGPGVSEEEAEAIFRPFVRGAGGRRGGRGLGLFIARRIVEAHGGRIWVESGGDGATFRIRLPAGADGWTSAS